jgi:2-keto-4-pentenoate hydratase/2-oxohepta-3-ene-1,7-dioic acid hydratase in catechol pathway
MIVIDSDRFTPGRVFCIGRNYAAHVAELGNAPAELPVVFMKPASSLVPDGMPLVLPRGLGAVHHEAELVLVVDEGGRGILEAEAPARLAGVTLGLDLTLREEQDRLKKAGLPWELAKAFDNSAPIGTRAVSLAGLDLGALEFTLDVNGARRQSGNTRQMLFPIARLVAFLSQRWELRRGDLIYTGTPAGVAPLVPGDVAVLSASWIGEFEWRCE